MEKAKRSLTDFERGVIIGLLVGEGHFGGMAGNHTFSSKCMSVTSLFWNGLEPASRGQSFMVPTIMEEGTTPN